MTESDDRADESLEALGERARARWEDDTTAALEASRANDDAFEDDDAFDDDAFDDDAIANAVLARLAPNVQELHPANDAVPRPGRRLGWVVVAVSLAAAIALWFGIRERGTSTTAPKIVRYEGTFAGGDHRTRAVEDPKEVSTEPRQLRAASSITWTLVPATSVDVSMTVWIEASAASHRRCVSIAPEFLTSHEGGALSIAGEAGAVLGLNPGSWSLRALVGPPSAFASMDDPCADDQRARHGIVSAGTQDVVIVP